MTSKEIKYPTGLNLVAKQGESKNLTLSARCLSLISFYISASWSLSTLEHAIRDMAFRTDFVFQQGLDKSNSSSKRALVRRQLHRRWTAPAGAVHDHSIFLPQSVVRSPNNADASRSSCRSSVDDTKATHTRPATHHGDKHSTSVVTDTTISTLALLPGLPYPDLEHHCEFPVGTTITGICTTLTRSSRRARRTTFSP